MQRTHNLRCSHGVLNSSSQAKPKPRTAALGNGRLGLNLLQVGC